MGEYPPPHTHTHTSPYRAQVLVLHLLKLGVGVAGTELHVPQHHLEHGVVDGLGEVHVQLVHGGLQRESQHAVMMAAMFKRSPASGGSEKRKTTRSKKIKHLGDLCCVPDVWYYMLGNTT